MRPHGTRPSCERRTSWSSVTRAQISPKGPDAVIEAPGQGAFTGQLALAAIPAANRPEGEARRALCRELIEGYLDGVTGEYAPPEGYFCAEREPEAFEAFDALFPPKEKLRLPGQLF